MRIDPRIREELRPVLDSVRFPVELNQPPGFRADDPSTWPRLEGRLELVRGRLLYMPPCGEVQAIVAVSVAYELYRWADAHPEFLVLGNEAGVLLDDDVRGAEALVVRRDRSRGPGPGYLREPPVLAVEVAGEADDEKGLREKAGWYLDHGVEVVWLLRPDQREVIVVTRDGDTRVGRDGRLPPRPSLPGLTPAVNDCFRKLDRA